MILVWAGVAAAFVVVTVVIAFRFGYYCGAMDVVRKMEEEGLL